MFRSYQCLIWTDFTEVFFFFGGPGGGASSSLISREFLKLTFRVHLPPSLIIGVLSSIGGQRRVTEVFWMALRSRVFSDKIFVIG